MELDRYGLILRRRSGLILLIVVVTALISGAYGVLVPGSYKATTQVLVDPIAPQSATAATYYYPPYYEEQAAQYILDDFTGVIEGTTFAEQVIAVLKQSPQADVRSFAAKLTTVDDATRLSKQLTINRVNRLLQIQVTASSQDEALAILAATDQIIKQQGQDFFTQMTQASGQSSNVQGISAVTIGVSDEPHITQKPSKLHAALFWLLRTAVGLVAGVTIALLLHYFDDRLYDEYDVREMAGLPVLGATRAPQTVGEGARIRSGAPARTPVAAR